MLAIPYQTKQDEFTVYLGLDADALGRIREYDPGVFQQSMLPAVWQKLRLTEIVIGFYTEADQKQIARLMQDGAVHDAIRFLTRGFAYRPDQGDHDGPALSLIYRGEPRQ